MSDDKGRVVGIGNRKFRLDVQENGLIVLAIDVLDKTIISTCASAEALRELAQVFSDVAHLASARGERGARACPKELGRVIARDFFDRRSKGRNRRNVEVHLSELELAELIAAVLAWARPGQE
jgi:hypothetical protein